MEIITLQNKSLFASNCYILCSDEAFSVIDPSVSYDEALSTCSGIGELKPEYVILTHGHVDHFWEIDSYVKKGCKVIVSKPDSKIMSRPDMNCYEFLEGNIDSYKGDFITMEDNDELVICGHKFLVIETPGHTAGSVSLLADDVIFTGDTLFADGVFGRYDLPTSNGADLLHSLKRLFALDENLVLYSGHGAPTTLKNTKDSFYNRRGI